MSQEHEPGELSAEEIAHRIGPASAPQPDQAPWTLYPPTTVTPGANPPSSFSPLPRRPIAAVTSATMVAAGIQAALPPVDRPPDPRSRLVRDTAATLLGLSAVALIVLAVWPPAPDAGVLRAIGVPAATSAPTAVPTGERTPAAEPTSEPTPTLVPTPEPSKTDEPAATG
jgi:hypothetical protein